MENVNISKQKTVQKNIYIHCTECNNRIDFT